MSKLTCSANKCVNNREGLCAAHDIRVVGPGAITSGETNCSNYEETTVKSALASLGNMNYVGEIKQMFNKDDIEMSPEIGCEAQSCRYNSGGHCKAYKVTISGAQANSMTNTCCETFMK